MNLIDQVKNGGVVGAGGAGFPTHVKLQAQAEWYLANGAECEPLMHKDRELMRHFANEIVAGLELAGQTVGANKMVIGVKSKNQTAIHALTTAIKNKNVSLHEFGDFYPAGDEYELVYAITGKLIPPQSIPLKIGVVVNNVETCYNIYQASRGIPVTDTFLTLAGLVKQPLTTRVPIGMAVREVLELAGGPTIPTYAVMESGLMMGKLVTDLNQPVTKTTGGLIVLPDDHPLIRRYQLPAKNRDRIGHSACDQCSYCTELCPRYLLGYQVQPHLVMRSLGFSVTGPELWNQYALLCCHCGLCTLYSCPESLYPREACGRGVTDLNRIGKGKWNGKPEVHVHPMKEARRVPIRQLMHRLGVTTYEAAAEFVEVAAIHEEVQILLKQHVGVPSEPVVKVGARVQRGQLIARIPENQLGANLHASIDGRVVEIDDQKIRIKR
ncbi:4Fe-4S dicluster domain-containing protein [candidate division KSB1 bacterium]|nr:4Fe-4S dicluster domain-containing protein [candidate division KSB1 bacterium]